MNKDGVDDAHWVIVSRASHSVVARVTKRGTLEISEGFFCCWATIRKAVLQFYISVKKD